MTVDVSPEARLGLSRKVREWTGWRDSTLVLGPTNPAISPWATNDMLTHTITADPESLILNPNKVLLTLSPFRLRQEAVLTGALLHEAGHARHSLWLVEMARTLMDGGTPEHDDTHEPVSKRTLALAKIIEEPRVESLIAGEVDSINATDLAWTMRASAAYLLPMTDVAADPAQAVLDVLTSWILRAGRQIAYASKVPTHQVPSWVHDFTALLTKTLKDHLATVDDGHRSPDLDALVIIRSITLILSSGSRYDTGTELLDETRDILALLFPETSGDEDGAPMPSGSCGAGEPEQEDEGESEPDSEGGTQDEQGEGEGDDEGEGEGQEGDEDDSPADGEGEDSETDEAGDQSGTASALAQMEQQADTEESAEAATQQASMPTPPSDLPAKKEPRLGVFGGYGDREGGGEWRAPTPAERGMAKNAERFLREVIAPNESSKVVLTESPSASVDGGALAAWRAGGQDRDPRFFKRVRRTVQPSPPIKVAILRDVSSSMEELQGPSGSLAWALSSAALDMRNFAGRGSQVQSCMIDWGNTARVMAGNGVTMPGVFESDCDEGTRAMDQALALVEQEMPGFFEPSDHPENRLLVQFTDWELSSWDGHHLKVVPYLARAFASGVNMLTVGPEDYTPRRSMLEDLLVDTAKQGLPMLGGSHLMKYNRIAPERVWDEASNILAPQ